MLKPFASLAAVLAIVGAFWIARPAPHIADAACFSTRPFGDVDSSYSVELADAMWMLRDSVGLFMPDVYCGPVDVNCDGAFTPVDSLDIMAYTVHAAYQQLQPCPKIGAVVSQP